MLPNTSVFNTSGRIGDRNVEQLVIVLLESTSV